MQCTSCSYLDWRKLEIPFQIKRSDLVANDANNQGEVVDVSVLPDLQSALVLGTGTST